MTGSIIADSDVFSPSDSYSFGVCLLRSLWLLSSLSLMCPVKMARLCSPAPPPTSPPPRPPPPAGLPREARACMLSGPSLDHVFDLLFRSRICTHRYTHRYTQLSYSGWWTKSVTCFELARRTRDLNWGETRAVTVAFKCVVWIFSDLRFLQHTRTHTHTHTHTRAHAQHAHTHTHTDLVVCLHVTEEALVSRDFTVYCQTL